MMKAGEPLALGAYMRMSDDGLCMAESGVLLIRRTLLGRRLKNPAPKMLATRNRILAADYWHVRVDGLGERVMTRWADWWVDVVTGTLYDLEGACINNPYLQIGERRPCQDVAGYLRGIKEPTCDA